MAGLGDEASAASDRSVEVLGDSTSRELLQKLLGWRSRLSMLLGQYRDAIPPGTEAVGLARRINASRELSRALNALGTSLTMAGNQEGLSMLREGHCHRGRDRRGDGGCARLQQPHRVSENTRSMILSRQRRSSRGTRLHNSQGRPQPDR